MPLLLENAHATALLSRVMNLVKLSCGTSEPKSDSCADEIAIAKEIQWLWPDSFSNNKYVIMTEMAGRVVGWFWVAKCNHNCWNSVTESFVKASYLPRTRHANQVTAEAFRVRSFLMCSLSLIMLSAPNSGKHRMETFVLFLLKVLRC